MSLLLVSNNILVRERWEGILRHEHHLTTADSLTQVRQLMEETDTQATLFHRNFADIEAIIGLAGHPLMVFADSPDDFEAVTLFRAGILCYANTYLTPRRLQQAVTAAVSGQVWIHASLMQRIIKGATSKAFQHGTPEAPPLDVTEREWEIAVLVSKGASNLEIAADLNISERTVKAHIGSIFKKTGTQSRLQLALLIRNRLNTL